MEHLNWRLVSFLINNICEGDKVLLSSGLFIDKLCRMMTGYKDKMKGQLIQLQIVNAKAIQVFSISINNNKPEMFFLQDTM